MSLRMFCPLCFSRCEAYEQWGELFVRAHKLQSTVDNLEDGSKSEVEVWCPMTNHRLLRAEPDGSHDGRSMLR